MLSTMKFCYSFAINFVIFELISGQLNELALNESRTSQYSVTSNRVFNNSYNTSITLEDITSIIRKLELEKSVKYNANSSESICDNIDCSNNIAICELNQCFGLKKIRKIHYVITCIIVSGIILLMLATIYACNKETKRSAHWHNTHNGCNLRPEQHLRALRILHSFNHNIDFQRNREIVFQEMIPFRVTSEMPPPYDSQYTPPPNYEEATSSSANQTTK